MILVAKKKSDVVFLDMSRLIGISSLVEKKIVKKISKIISYDDDLLISKLVGTVLVTEPSPDYSVFDGSIKLETSPTAYQITTENLLFSGAELKGAGSVIGFVVYCGPETRTQLNTDPFKKKHSRIERIVNWWVFILLIVLAFIVTGSVFGYFYASSSDMYDGNALSMIVTFVLLYNNIIPISLFLAIDIIRILQCFVFTYHNQNFSFNTEIVNENLGQVEILVTEKTGTLIEKKLAIKTCIIGDKIFNLEGQAEITNSVAGDSTTNVFPSTFRVNETLTGSFSLLKSYLSQEINTKALSFMNCMTLCNNLHQKNGEYFGKHEEMALVETAKLLGYSLGIHSHKILELESNNRISEYQVVCNMPFKQKNKISRVLLKDTANNQGILYVKGSYKVLLACLDIDPYQAEEINQHIKEFKTKGQRCIILAYKLIAETDMLEYNSRIRRIIKSSVNREGRLEGVFRNIGKNLVYLGILALSEEILPGINKTLGNLEKAGIKV